MSLVTDIPVTSLIILQSTETTVTASPQQQMCSLLTALLENQISADRPICRLPLWQHNGISQCYERSSLLTAHCAYNSKVPHESLSNNHLISDPHHSVLTKPPASQTPHFGKWRYSGSRLESLPAESLMSYYNL